MKEDDLKGKETINSVIRQKVDEVSYGRMNLELRWAHMLERKGRKVPEKDSGDRCVSGRLIG